MNKKQQLLINPVDRAEFLDDRIEFWARQVAAPLLGVDYSSFANPAIPLDSSAADSIVVGRIVALGSADSSDGLEQSIEDGPSKGLLPLQLGNLYLECSRRMGSGCRIQLTIDVDASVDLQLFPGQLVALKGRNVDGTSFCISQQLLLQQSTQASTLNLTQSASSNSNPSNTPLIMAAAGPFCTLNSTFDWSRLESVFKSAIAHRVQVLILLGPFFPDYLAFDNSEDNSNPISVFQSKLSQIINAVHQSHVAPHLHIALVPHLEDLLADPILPQSPFRSNLFRIASNTESIPVLNTGLRRRPLQQHSAPKSYVHLLGNPDMISVTNSDLEKDPLFKNGGLHIAISSVDQISALFASELVIKSSSAISKESSPKFIQEFATRFASHVIQQQTLIFTEPVCRSMQSSNASIAPLPVDYSCAKDSFCFTDPNNGMAPNVHLCITTSNHFAPFAIRVPITGSSRFALVVNVGSVSSFNQAVLVNSLESAVLINI